MKPSKSALKAVFVWALALASAVCAVAALVHQSEAHSAREPVFYQDDAVPVSVNPGLNITIQSVTIPADRRPIATFMMTDDQGQPLDRSGVLTPATVATSFIMAYLPRTSDHSIPQYTDYSTRPETDSKTGFTTQQAATDSGGTYTSLGNGVYTYRFGTVLPVNYDPSLTHTLGIYGTRDLSEFGLSFYVSNVTKDFVPNGSPVTQRRQIIVTAACNQCHDPLSAHGTTGRRDVEICVLCHTPQTVDAETRRTVDFKVMIHKIHMGSSLPSVQAGTPYQLIGFGGAVSDFSDVVFPRDIRNCQSCHQNSPQVNAWLLFPSIETCGSCHDDINFATGQNHPGGAYSDSADCSSCHLPQGWFEYDASIAGAHTVPYKSTQLVNPKFTILNITNAGPGQSPTIQFKIADKNGNPISPAQMGGAGGRLAATIAGPTTDYTFSLQESANTASYVNGIASYTFKGTIPASATGTFAAELEGYVNTTLIKNGDPTDTFVYRDAADNAVQYFAVTGSSAIPRRTVVALSNCDVCHDKLQAHGNNRNQIEACVMCHNPNATDSALRPAAAAPPETIDMQILIHKIHTGENLHQPYTIYGFGGSVNAFNDVAFPGDRRDCVKCHVDASFTVPLPAGVQPAITPHNYFSPTPPIAAACTACHDTVEAAAHAFVNIALINGVQIEGCPQCHREGANEAVTRVHAR